MEFHLSSWKSETLHYGGPLFKKLNKISAKRVQKTYLPWRWRVMQSLKKNLWFQIWHEEFGEFSPNHSKVWKCYSDGLFLSKVHEFWAKKYRGVIFHDTEQGCKIWKTLTLWFLKWHEELSELSSLKHPKVWKLHIDGLLCPKYILVQLESFRGKICHDNEGCCKV